MRLPFDLVIVGTLLTLGMIAVVGESNAQQKAPVQDVAALETSQKAAAELFGGRFRSAKTLAKKMALAAEMIDAALRLEVGSADQFVLLKIVREIASGAGDAAAALLAAERQAERFDLPAAKLQGETLLVIRSTSAVHSATTTCPPRGTTTMVSAWPGA
jgi:hypothetical protein